MSRCVSYKTLQTFPGVLKKALQSIERRTICIAGAYHDCIIDEIKSRDNIEYDRKIHNGDK